VSPRVQIVRVPGNPSRRARAGRSIRRGATAAGRAIADEKHTLTAIVAAAGLGLAKRQDIKLPKIDAIGTAGTYGAIAWVGARFMKSRTLAHVATGLLSVAAFSMAAGDELTGDEDDW
jgi:cell wall assembly regulator SMI1